MDALIVSSKHEDLYFPFLQLPGELRNKVYKLLLKNTNRLPSGSHTKTGGHYVKLSICAAILRVSKQIYREAAPYLYTLNRFNAHPTLLKQLPFLVDHSRPVKDPACCDMITRFYIAVRLDNDPWWNAEKLALAFSGIKELEVEAWQPSYGITDIANLRPFAQVRGVGKARVHGSGVPNDFCRWLENVMQSPVGAVFVDWRASEWNEWADGDK